jgi:hypothetical protein
MANYCIRWRRIFKGLLRDGRRGDFSKNLPRLSQMSLISAGSISLDSSVPFPTVKREDEYFKDGLVSTFWSSFKIFYDLITGKLPVQLMLEADGSDSNM